MQINSSDSTHRLTDPKSLLEYCLDTHSSKPFEILFTSQITNIDVNILCTDGLPFFFHCFDESISTDVRQYILFNSNMYIKSKKGETFLFHLIYIYSQDENKEYLNVFLNIIQNYPLLITHRNEQEQTVVEYMEMTTSKLVYQQLRPFYNAIMEKLILQLKNDSIIEQFILNDFGYLLILFYKDKTLQMTKHAYYLLRSLKVHQGLPVLISNFKQSIIDDDLAKLKNILKIKSNIYHAKDSFGRSCAQLAVLYQRYTILR